MQFKVGITSLGQLCAIWVCNPCMAERRAYISLEKLITYMPAHPPQEPKQENQLTAEDEQCLREMFAAMPLQGGANGC